MVAGSVQVFDVDYNTFAGVSPELCKDQNQMKALKQFGGPATGHLLCGQQSPVPSPRE